ncbi:hypothetical protein NW768_001166 [Fusarium equiseti]|uniref:C2H2-type domain-containing protein n=1 Tax=Fusarium equiseti TaxID=61235 RepID=A0ABQ8RPP9_FUSEQ|nr:hypothetical protein NW768_001166 [Fusarium equiseti]
MSSFTPINNPASAPAFPTALVQDGLLTPPPTPPPVAVAPALLQFGLLTPPPSPPPATPAMPPPPPPTPATSAPAPAPAPAPVRTSASSRTCKWRKCPDCHESFSYKNIADHKKVHRMLRGEGGLARPCNQCKKHPERCYVAIHPEQLNTYSCACCLSSHKACSFKSIKVERWNEWAERHPFLLEKENIPPEEEGSTSGSSVEEKPPHRNRAWEL